MSTLLALPAASVPTTSLALWFDAADSATLFANTAGTIAVAGGATSATVALWRDKSGLGRHLVLPAGSTTVSVANQLDGAPLVSIPGVATFTGTNTPLAAAGGGAFTIVAVWRVLPGGGGHPFNVNAKGVFSPASWVEGIAVDTSRTMPAPTTAGVDATNGSVVVGVWKLVGGSLAHHLGALTDAGGGYLWSTAAASVPPVWATTNVATVGTAGKSLHLAELLAWTTGLSDTQLAGVDAYLRGKWSAGLPLTVAPATTVSSALPGAASADVGANANAILWLDASDASTLFSDAAGTTLVTPGVTVLCWKDKSSRHNHATCPYAPWCATYTTNIWNGRSVLDSSSNKIAMSLTTATLLKGAPALTVFVVAKAKPSTNTNAPLNFIATDTSWFPMGTKVVEQIGFGGPTAFTCNPAVRPILYIVVVNPSTGTTTTYGSDATTVLCQGACSQAYWSTNAVYIGGSYFVAGTSFTGQLAEIVVLNVALTASTTPTLADAAAGLRTKWNIS